MTSSISLSLSRVALGAVVAGVLVHTATALAGSIVPDFDDSTAIFSSTMATTTTISSPTLANGLTLAATLTPNATDISNSMGGAVGLLEIGGTTNGTGFYIIDGELIFITKYAASTAAPDSLPSLDGSTSVIAVSLGTLDADEEVSFFASLDTVNGSLLVSIDSEVTTYSLTNVDSTWNWRGNSTVSFGELDNTLVNGNYGYRGALSDDSTDGLYFTNLAYDFTGTLGEGQIFNAVSAVPEPAALALLGLALTGLFVLRRATGMALRAA